MGQDGAARTGTLRPAIMPPRIQWSASHLADSSAAGVQVLELYIFLVYILGTSSEF